MFRFPICIDPFTGVSQLIRTRRGQGPRSARWRESDLFTPLERDVMEYAEAMSQTPPTVIDELSTRLLEQLGAPGLVELTAFAAMANQMARTNVALVIEPQGFSAAWGLAPLAQPSSVAS
jgi:hypothetical protein